MTEKKKAGGPRIEKEIQKRRNITLSDRLAGKAKKIGGGSASAGIRKALEFFIGESNG